MRLCHLIFIVMVAALSGCAHSTQYVRDRTAVVETVRSIFDHPYAGLSRWMPAVSQSPPDPSFGGEHRWVGEAGYRAVYRPATAGGAVNAATLLEHYFARLEQSDFRSGLRGFNATTTTDSVEIADKTWSNKGRTIFVTGLVVSDKKTGEAIITAIVTGR
jgi:hypothetical protein